MSIEAEVHRNDQLLMQRTYDNVNISLETVLKSMESYIVNEQLNHNGECFIRVRYANLEKTKYRGY